MLSGTNVITLNVINVLIFFDILKKCNLNYASFDNEFTMLGITDSKIKTYLLGNSIGKRPKTYLLIWQR